MEAKIRSYYIDFFFAWFFIIPHQAMRDRILDVWGELGLTSFLIYIYIYIFFNLVVWAWEVHGQENRLV